MNSPSENRLSEGEFWPLDETDVPREVQAYTDEEQEELNKWINGLGSGGGS